MLKTLLLIKKQIFTYKILLRSHSKITFELIECYRGFVRFLLSSPTLYSDNLYLWADKSSQYSFLLKSFFEYPMLIIYSYFSV